MRHRPNRPVQLTDRGWAVLTVLLCLAAALVGALITQGDDPCGFAVMWVECTP